LTQRLRKREKNLEKEKFLLGKFGKKKRKRIMIRKTVWIVGLLLTVMVLTLLLSAG
jgi:hypothetical protein